MARKKDTKKGIKEIDTPIENIKTIQSEDIETIGEKEVAVEDVVNDITNEDNNIISLDNAPVSPLIQSEDEIIPKGFVKIQPKKPTSTESKIKLHNGRVYKDVGNGYGMYADTGEVFRIR